MGQGLPLCPSSLQWDLPREGVSQERKGAEIPVPPSFFQSGNEGLEEVLRFRLLLAQPYYKTLENPPHPPAVQHMGSQQRGQAVTRENQLVFIY